MVISALIPALGRQRQVDLEFEASLVYRVNSRISRAILRVPVSKKKRGGVYKVKHVTIINKFFVVAVVFQDRVSLCSPGCPELIL